MILLIGDLRVVDISSLMSFLTWIRLTAYRVVSDCDLARSLFAHQAGIGLCKVTYARGWMRMCAKFQDEILLGGGGGGECETPRKS